MTHEELAAIEAESIRDYVQWAANEGYLSGRVLDYGCGKQPYRKIVALAGGTYVGYDSPQYGGSVVTREVGDHREVGRFDWRAILCTQVLQYVHHVPVMLRGFKTDLEQGRGHLVLTYPTTWPEIRDDLWRFTKLGMERLLADAGFTIIDHSRRAVIPHQGFELALGYGVVAQA